MSPPSNPKDLTCGKYSISKKTFNNNLLNDIFDYSDSPTRKGSVEINVEMQHIKFPLIKKDL